MSTVKNYLSLIRFSHTIFAMPFAMIGFFLGLVSLHAEHGIGQLNLSREVFGGHAHFFLQELPPWR